ncbi:glycosyltransferase family 2 protein [Desulfolutivibrio sulfoxidireducens]|uniref:glycosyltransferase family 2 protein n=1 Tax=Desulfolutivibrio sulfoxidireducens TaxID=2773299 RepID=UPI00159D9A63|nr:glycosyltransferase [Desulfolutivibrio sulfoxidireducens]QLA14820.1 glycosyltransferase [Desulfolutivibrio sulfoxidireducens]
MDRVSVVVPAYNQARYLPMCLDSIWFQDYPDVEIVVVDDGSTDGTRQVLDRYVEDVERERASYASYYDAAQGVVKRTWHPRFPPRGRRLARLEHQANQGLGAALNSGFGAATGEACTFLAADDTLLPSMVSELMRALTQSEADFAYADMHIVDDAGRILRRFSLPDYSFEACFCRWYLCGVCKLYWRRLHAEHGYYDPKRVSQDHEMYLRFAMGGARFVHVGKVLANVRIHDRDRKVDNHSPEKESRQIADSIELVRMAREFVARARATRGVP